MKELLTGAPVAILVGICLAVQVVTTFRLYGAPAPTSPRPRTVGILLLTACVVIVVSLLRFMYLA